MNVQKYNTQLISSALLVSAIFLFPSSTLASEITPDKVIELANKERQLRGLNALKVDPELSTAASAKSATMIVKNYFEHFAFGVSPWVLIKNEGYNYQFAGENLAMDFNTSEGMVQAWMKSPAHRQNILNSNFEDIGVGVVKGEFTEADGSNHQTIMVTQMFGKRKPVVLEFASKLLFRLFGVVQK